MLKRVISATLALMLLVSLAGMVAYGKNIEEGSSDLVMPYNTRASYEYLDAVNDNAYADGLNVTVDSLTDATQTVDKIGMSVFVLQRWGGSTWSDYKTIAGRYSNNASSKTVELTTAVAVTKAGTNFRWKVTHYVKEGTKEEEFVNYSNEVYVPVR